LQYLFISKYIERPTMLKNQRVEKTSAM